MGLSFRYAMFVGMLLATISGCGGASQEPSAVKNLTGTWCRAAMLAADQSQIDIVYQITRSHASYLAQPIFINVKNTGFQGEETGKAVLIAKNTIENDTQARFVPLAAVPTEQRLVGDGERLPLGVSRTGERSGYEQVAVQVSGRWLEDFSGTTNFKLDLYGIYQQRPCPTAAQ